MNRLSTVLVALSLVNAVYAQTACPIYPAAVCNHTLDGTVVIPDGTVTSSSVLEFMPTKPGGYVFSYQAEDLCTSKTSNFTVFAQCPPKPIAVATVNQSAPFLQGNYATLSSTGSKVNWDGGLLKSVTFILKQGPANHGLVNTSLTVNSTNQISVGPLNVPGQYVYQLTVDDGCSYDTATVCFDVKCNCVPTANAGATTTIWTNTAGTANGGATASMTNVVSLTNGPDFLLDGSMSYDFDRMDVLVYTWDFVEWVAATAVNARTWSVSKNLPATTAADGFMTTKTTTVSNSGNVDTYIFSKKPQIRQPTSALVPPVPTGVDQAVAAAVAAVPQGYPKTCPSYITTEEHFGAPTTSHIADITRTVRNQSSVQKFTQTKTDFVPDVVQDTVYCQIQISQDIVAQRGALAKNNPLGKLRVSSLKDCTGMWTFRLTVMDGCGAANSDFDDITVNVRCNEPPVAIAACDNTQMWTGSAFDQVRLDGRSSNDMDSSSLTYSWSFDDGESVRIQCKDWPATSTAGHIPCVETYCQNTQYYTRRDPASGVTTRDFSLGSDAGCRPTKFPMLYDPNNNNSPVSPTQFHVGNTAYFVPKTKGTYTVRLSVSDGCSTSTSTVNIIAICPDMTVDFTMNPASEGVKPVAGPFVLKATSTFTYSGNTQTMAASYTWVIKSGASVSTTATARNQGQAVTDIEFTKDGTYSIQVSLSDNCQSVSSAVKTFVVKCNNPPINLKADVTEPAGVAAAGNIAIYDGLSYPQFAVKASATDADSDPLTYSFVFDPTNKVVVPTQQSGDTLRFTPVFGSGNTTYKGTVMATDGCSTTAALPWSFQMNCRQQLVAAPGNPKTISYLPTAANPFEATTFDGSGSKDPYSTVQGHSTSYSWTVKYQGGATSEEVSSSRFTGATLQQFVLTPDKVGTYAVTLTVNDGCQQSSVTLYLITKCDTAATANIVVTPSSNSVQWDSFKTDTAGAFPDVALDGSTSKGYDGAQLDYTWSPGASNPAGAVVTSPAVKDIKITPALPGTYAFSLTVRNGPCPASASRTVTFIANCNSLKAKLKDVTGVARESQIVIDNVVWDGTKFPLVELDGTMTEYLQLDATPRVGNLKSLQYTWTMIESPQGSCYEAYNLAAELNGVVGSTTKSPLADVPISTTAKTVNGVNGTETVTTVSYLATTYTAYTTTKTLLFNHHYNLPHTCFKPDLAGQYKVVLNITDACTASSVTATIKVACRQSPTADINTVLPVSLSGNKFQRVALTATVTFAPGEEMSYQWTITDLPAASKLLKGPNSINNNQMPEASFVPDKEGDYTFMFVAADGCNPAVNRTITVKVQCNSGMTVKPVTVDRLNIQFRNYSTGTVNEFLNQKFKLTGVAETSCQVLRTRWLLSPQRTCAPNYVLTTTVAPTPAPSGPTCSPPGITCMWSLMKSPCNSTTVNPNYLPPLMTPASGSASQLQDCKAQFTPQFPGTYTLQLMVKDSCSYDVATVQVVAKCSTTVTANAGSNRDAFFKCQGANIYGWDSLTITGEAKSVGPQSMPAVVDSCPPTAVAPTCTDANKLACCPAAASGSTCCNIQCPMCPQCPQCPACPSATTGAGGWASFAAARDRVLAQATEELPRTVGAFQAPVLMSVVTPLVALVVLSVAANVVMVQKISKRKASAHNAVLFA